ncbi:unnamed protein product [Clonostachys solani]|uniref:Uncharacterized protein n=1 Tax=Clonostachys solani TaxID=160281 RepID=A0A9N9Z6H9_9HYPO|nr:unnamed protein product [Clonostachys solani]
MAPRPVVLPPATPAQCLLDIASRYSYPTTVIITSTKEHFLGSLYEEASMHEEQRAHDSPQTPILCTTLLQVAASRHIRVLFVPTVTHLRAYLSVFSKEDSRVPQPPHQRPGQDSHPALVVYGFLWLHRDTSEWSAQGLGDSAAALVEAAARNKLRAVVIEPTSDAGPAPDPDSSLKQEEHPLKEQIPLLSEKKAGSWTARTVELHRVLTRWFEIEPQTSHSNQQ